LLWQLQEKSFRWTTERVPAAKPDELRAGETGDTGRLVTEEGIKVYLNAGVAFAEKPPDKPRATLIVHNPGEEIDLIPVPVWSKSHLRGDAVAHLFFPRGIKSLGKVSGDAPTNWLSKSSPSYVERSMALVGTTVDAGRVRDIAATIRYLDEERKGKYTWRVMGRGQSGVLAAYAALFEPSIKEVVIIDPPTSHIDGPIFLNVLRVLDVPDALGLLAPTPLTLINVKDNSFERTEQIYRLAGAQRKLTIK
jgi:hypothetical protein